MIGNERFMNILTQSRIDIFVNVYSPDDLFELNTYGESVWGEHGYTENRIAYGEFYVIKSVGHLYFRRNVVKRKA